MGATALVIWIITAMGGLYMLGITMDMGRPREEAANTHWPSFLMFLHPAFAFAGAAVYYMFLMYDERSLAWIAFADLVLVATLGDVLLVTWLKDRRGERRAEQAGATRAVPMVRNYVPRPQQGRVQVEAPERVPVTALSEQRIPSLAVAAHGGLAVLTIVLVFLTAIGVGS
jgi:hypothetical protein